MSIRSIVSVLLLLTLICCGSVTADNPTSAPDSTPVYVFAEEMSAKELKEKELKELKEKELKELIENKEKVDSAHTKAMKLFAAANAAKNLVYDTHKAYIALYNVSNKMIDEKEKADALKAAEKKYEEYIAVIDEFVKANIEYLKAWDDYVVIRQTTGVYTGLVGWMTGPSIRFDGIGGPILYPRFSL